ncbi:unnamed protein product [Paramecium octaurelia]|uniref:Uncharacterized protein n=1 Tax=Paramecium octaurelia TaxID=43137 RepID=A0A8S1XBP5_PAROT|nr:unnamed protein product [Paramecium octaurelia]
MQNDPIIQVYSLWDPNDIYYLTLRVGTQEKIKIQYRTWDEKLKCLNTYDMNNIDKLNHYKYIKKHDYCNIQTDCSFQSVNKKNLIIFQQNPRLRNIQILHFLIIGMLFFKKKQKSQVNMANINQFLQQILEENQLVYMIVRIVRDIQSKISGIQAKYLIPSKFNWERIKILDEIAYPPLIKYQEQKQQMYQNSYRIRHLNGERVQRLMRDEFYGFELQDYENICILKKGLFQNGHFQGELIEFDKQRNELIHYISIKVNNKGEKLGEDVRICYISIQVNPIVFKMKRYYRGEFNSDKQNGNGIMIQYNNQEERNIQFYYSGRWQDGFLNSFGIFENLNQKANEQQLQERQQDKRKLQYRKYIGQFNETQFHGQGIAYLMKKIVQDKWGEKIALTGKFQRNILVGQYIKTELDKETSNQKKKNKFSNIFKYFDCC